MTRPCERWTQRQYDRWTPLVEGNLVLVEGDLPDVHTRYVPVTT